MFVRVRTVVASSMSHVMSCFLIYGFILLRDYKLWKIILKCVVCALMVVYLHREDILLLAKNPVMLRFSISSHSNCNFTSIGTNGAVLALKTVARFSVTSL